MRRALRNQRFDETFIWLACRDYNRACIWHGVWAERRDQETKQVPAKKSDKPMASVKKYTTLYAVLNLPEPGTPQAGAPSARNDPKTAADKRAMELIRDPAAMAEYMAALTEG